MRVSHFIQCCPVQPGTTTRSGKPCGRRERLAVHRPGQQHAARAHVGHSEGCGRRPACRPAQGRAHERPRGPAPSARPARSSSASSRVPVHRACPRAARPHASPGVGGSKKRRPLPAHSRMSRRVSAGSASTSAWSSVSGALHQALERANATTPDRRRAPDRASAGRKCSTGVSCPISSSARPSMFNGSSERTIRSGFIGFRFTGSRVHGFTGSHLRISTSLQSAIRSSQVRCYCRAYGYHLLLAHGTGRRGGRRAGRAARAPRTRPTPSRRPKRPPAGVCSSTDRARQAGEGTTSRTSTGLRWVVKDGAVCLPPADGADTRGQSRHHHRPIPSATST